MFSTMLKTTNLGAKFPIWILDQSSKFCKRANSVATLLRIEESIFRVVEPQSDEDDSIVSRAIFCAIAGPLMSCEIMERSLFLVSFISRSLLFCLYLLAAWMIRVMMVATISVDIMIRAICNLRAKCNSWFFSAISASFSLLLNRMSNSVIFSCICLAAIESARSLDLFWHS